MEHTHLVKGLDYALMRSVKAEMNDTNESAETEHINEGQEPESDSVGKEEMPPPKQGKKKVKFHSTMARALYHGIFAKTTTTCGEFFIPGILEVSMS